MVERLTLFEGHGGRHPKEETIWADLRFNCDRLGEMGIPGEKRVYKGKESWAVVLT